MKVRVCECVDRCVCVCVFVSVCKCVFVEKPVCFCVISFCVCVSKLEREKNEIVFQLGSYCTHIMFGGPYYLLLWPGGWRKWK